MPAREQGDEQQVEHTLLADDALADLVEDLASCAGERFDALCVVTFVRVAVRQR
ncbi:hypothetical protein D3C83_196010 [compost metagenome]